MNTLQNQIATSESIWAILQETNKTLKEIGKKQEEVNLQREKDREQMKKSNEDFDRRMKKINETLGGWGNNLGEFAEEYFFNSFEQGQRNFFGENFDKIRKKIGGIHLEDEYDILLINGKSIGIIEVKFKAHEKDVPKVLRKAETFRVNFPEYKNHQIYLGLATLSFYPELEEECINEGIAIIRVYVKLYLYILRSCASLLRFSC